MSKTGFAFAISLLSAGCGAPLQQDADLSAGAPDLAMASDGGGGGKCSPACSGLSPHCNPTGHCVACLTDENCAAGSYCKVISDAVSICTPGCMTDERCKGMGAPPTVACCNGQCVDTAVDGRHCGGCGKGCMAVHASVTCVAGMCMAGKCDQGWGDCDKDGMNGCEANLHADVDNCTMCGAKCAIPNAFSGCADGCYATACKFGFDDCNLNAMDGCETAVLSDKSNCGGCGKPCLNLPNASASCVNGSCLLGMCNAGFANCDGMAANGCEVNIYTSAQNCGVCGNVCANGLVCTNGGCTCPQCNFANASSKCVNNVCILDKCNQGFGDCDNNAANGCEKDLRFDNLNCNACNTPCPNGQFCVNAVCGNQGLPCSMVAKNTCLARQGWTVPQGGDAMGGRMYCTKGVGTGSDCNTCTDYNMYVWKDAAKPLYCVNNVYTTKAGTVYAGHSPCQCGDNLLNCGAWNMQNCVPD